MPATFFSHLKLDIMNTSGVDRVIGLANSLANNGRRCNLVIMFMHLESRLRNIVDGVLIELSQPFAKILR